MDGSDAPGKGGAVYGLHGALCLEPQVRGRSTLLRRA